MFDWLRRLAGRRQQPPPTPAPAPHVRRYLLTAEIEAIAEQVRERVDLDRLRGLVAADVDTVYSTLCRRPEALDSRLQNRDEEHYAHILARLELQRQGIDAIWQVLHGRKPGPKKPTPRKRRKP